MAARDAQSTVQIANQLKDIAATLKATAYGGSRHLQGVSGTGPNQIEERDQRVLCMFYERVEDEAAALQKIAKDIAASTLRPTGGA